jgi:hypothetical protein
MAVGLVISHNHNYHAQEPARVSFLSRTPVLLSLITDTRSVSSLGNDYWQLVGRP